VTAGSNGEEQKVRSDGRMSHVISNVEKAFDDCTSSGDAERCGYIYTGYGRFTVRDWRRIIAGTGWTRTTSCICQSEIVEGRGQLLCYSEGIVGRS